MPKVHLKRSAVLAGLVSVAIAGMTLLTPVAAMAAHGTQPGNLVLNPASGDLSTKPTWSTTTGCPSGTNAAVLDGYDTNGTAVPLSNPVTLPGTTPISNKQVLANMGVLLGNLDVQGVGSGTFEFVVNCQAALGDLNPVQATFVTLNADGTWTSSGTVTGPVDTTTTVSASTPSVADGGQVTFTAHVAAASGSADGTVQFFEGANALAGPFQLVSGSAEAQLTLSGVGTTHTIVAKFTPTNSNAFKASQGSTSVLVTGGLIQSETINVNIPISEGKLILTVDNSHPVDMGQAVLNTTTFSTFSASGTLNNVTVSDERNQTVPGWHLTGKVGNFVNKTNSNLTIDGKYLGWTPNLVSSDATQSVLAGNQVAPNSPGLTTESGLGSAALGKGLHQSVFNAGLSLLAPSSTQPGDYTATMTITLYEAP
jgi:hypothetical protein